MRSNSTTTKSVARGSPLARSSQPVMRLLDLLGRRWALRVIWELRDGPLRFRALRERCDEISPSVLNDRLADLRGAGIVELDEGEGYRLSPEGRKLGRTLLEVDTWARRWARRGN